MRNLGFKFCVILFATLLCNDAYSQQINKLVMPGRVTAAHADIEAQCDACHSSSAEIPQSTLCLDCHEDVAADRADGTGFHGRFATAKRNECVNCHTDHEGRDKDIVGIDRGLFDHGLSDFPLTGSHVNVTCNNCHQPSQSFHEAPLACVDCHNDVDVHDGGLGAQCESCHNTLNFSDVTFDHTSTGFSLTAGHADTACLDCHRGNRFDQAPTSCNGCHQVDDVHNGSKGTQCAQCHSTSTWSGIDFDHLAETGFALTAGHSGLVCEACHSQSDYKGASPECTACHRPDDHHQGQFGDACQDCHAVSHWPAGEFDHTTTAFMLDGAHDGLQCASCHSEVGEVTVTASCVGCHAADDPHAGTLGDCGSCHSNSDWSSEVRFDHDLSGFPLLGLHATVACTSCHESANFSSAPTQCVDCHQDDDVHEGGLGAQCDSCHSPNNWAQWQFDHDTQTEFPLVGQHAGLTCLTCHSEESGGLNALPTNCVACHRNDDPHEGQFGERCESCHSPADFAEILP